MLRLIERNSHHLYWVFAVFTAVCMPVDRSHAQGATVDTPGNASESWNSATEQQWIFYFEEPTEQENLCRR
ncbi:hypothetical protein G7039_29185 (plasmid) [Rhizobium leguminosarum]|nr:hypothetical protein G7039_29185 [Rhizobium leguminosarum]